jgi:Transposase zinc-binding domain
MGRSGPEVADVFRRYGDAYREQHDGSLSTAQRRVMTAIEICRTAALGGHVEQCDACGHQRISYCSCIMGKFSNGESRGLLSKVAPFSSAIALLVALSCPHKSGPPRRYG